ncbi:hypothetical protein HZA97_05010 [Candidatus Woesearchaeota archaeon]|nr:hypothetical protein [Candidatus Woesearchaeota archaeon]
MYSIKKEAVLSSLILGVILTADVAQVKLTNSRRTPVVEQAYNYVSHPFLNLEQQLERDFSIIYEGDQKEEVIKALYQNLSEMKSINPALLKHIKKIKVLTPEESVGLEYIGLAHPKGDPVFDSVILRCDYSLSKLAHELAHIEYNYSLASSDLFFQSFFNPPITKGKGWRTTWEDGTRGPKKGYISPNATRNIDENVAQYVELFYYKDDCEFWKGINKEEFDYETPLRYLWASDLITEKQFKEIIDFVRK